MEAYATLKKSAYQAIVLAHLLVEVASGVCGDVNDLKVRRGDLGGHKVAHGLIEAGVIMKGTFLSKKLLIL